MKDKLILYIAMSQAIVLGGKTYRQIKNELSPDKWPYEGMPWPCYVCTRQQHQYDPNVQFTSLPPGQQVLDLISKRHSGNIWLMGGGEIIRCFMRENLIDEYYIYIMPTAPVCHSLLFLLYSEGKRLQPLLP